VAVGYNWAVFTHLKAQPLLADESLDVSDQIGQGISQSFKGGVEIRKPGLLVKVATTASNLWTTLSWVIKSKYDHTN